MLPYPSLPRLKRTFVTGAAGFIGSHLADHLLAAGTSVVGWDNFSTGQDRFLADALQNSRFRLVRGDNLDLAALTAAMQGCDFVFHLAANADVRFGTEHPAKDLQQNTVATFNVLEAMRANGIKGVAFASTGSVYGEAAMIPTPEDAAFPIQTSLYGASKLACEGLLAAYAEGFGFESTIFRFVSVLGERYTHGHVFDFHRQLLDHPDHLDVLGDGTQKKSYLYVQDCIDAMLHVIRRGQTQMPIDSRAAVNQSTAGARRRPYEKAPSDPADALGQTGEQHRRAPVSQAPAHPGGRGTQIYNLGTPEYVQVSDSIRIICRELGLNPKINFSGGNRGWIGDNPFIFLDTAKIQATGWKPKLTIEQGIVRTLRWLEANRWVYETRR